MPRKRRVSKPVKQHRSRPWLINVVAIAAGVILIGATTIKLGTGYLQLIGAGVAAVIAGVVAGVIIVKLTKQLRRRPEPNRVIRQVDGMPVLTPEESMRRLEAMLAEEEAKAEEEGWEPTVTRYSQDEYNQRRQAG